MMIVGTTICGNCRWTDRIDEEASLHSCSIDCTKTWTDKKIRLDVLAHNRDAVAFYKRYGFRIGVFRMEK